MTIPKKHKRLNTAEWTEAEAQWECGAVTLEELSHQFGITTRAFQLHFDKRGIKKGSKAEEIATAIRKEVFQLALGDPSKIQELAMESRQTAFNNAKQIEGMVMAQLASAQKTPETAYRAATAIKTLGIAAQTLERISAMKWAALGLDQKDDGGELPVIRIIDLTDKDVEELRERQAAEDLEELGDDNALALGEDDNELIVTGEDDDEVIATGEDEEEAILYVGQPKPKTS